MTQVLEQRLIRAFQEQLRHYDRALALAGQQTLDSLKRSGNPWAHELRAALGEIATADAAIAEDKTAWRESGQTPGKELGEVLACVAERIRALSDCVNRQVASLQAHKQELLPEIDAFIRQRRMLQAYGAGS